MKIKLHYRWKARVVYYKALMLEEQVKDIIGYYNSKQKDLTTMIKT